MHVHVLKLFFFFPFFSKNECVVFTEMQALVNREMIATAIFPPHILVLALLMFLQQYYSYGTTHATQYQEIFELGQAFDIL